MTDLLADVRKLAVEIAMKEVAKDVKESDGRNRGPEIDKYMKRGHAPLDEAYNWCGMFVYYCFDEAGKKLGKTLPIRAETMWSGRKVKRWCGNNWNKVVWDLPLQAGDIYVLYSGHIGLIADSYSMDDIFLGKTVTTIDGNQVVGKDHDPTKVSLRKRHRDFAHMEYVIRF